MTVINPENGTEQTISIFDGDNLQRVADRVGKAAGVLGL